MLGPSCGQDKVIWATGYVPNTGFLCDGAASDAGLRRALDDRGFVRVDASLRVLGFDHIFAYAHAKAQTPD